METVVSSLVRHFKKWEIKHVFGIPGKPLVPLLIELNKQNIEFVLAKNECGAGYMAGGYALMNDRIGVAVGTSGPGGTNLLTAAGQAKEWRVPVLFITGQPPISLMGKALGQDSTMFGTDLVKMFEPVTKFSARVERADVFPMMLKHAVEKASSGIRGPVHLSIPMDVLHSEIEEFELELNDTEHLISPKIDQMISKINNAKNPVLLLGKGVHAVRAYKEVKELAERWGIPVMTTPGGKGTFEENHELSLGALGLGGTEKSTNFMEKGNIDLMIVIGSTLSDMSMVGIEPKSYPKEVIHMDYDIKYMEKSLVVPTLPILGDLRTNLKILLNNINNKEPKVYTKQEESYALKGSNNEFMLAVDTVKIMRQELSDDTIVFGDDGSHSFYAIQDFTIRQHGTFFFDDVFGAMGHGLCYAIGMQSVNNDAKVVCITGDGCTFMQGTEISTAVNHNIPVTIIVINNGRLDMVDKSMKYNSGGSLGAIYSKPLDVKMFAESMGVKAFKCNNEYNFREALKTSQLLREPTVIEVMVDTEEIPPILKRGR